jgi:hypothetical protein
VVGTIGNFLQAIAFGLSRSADALFLRVGHGFAPVRGRSGGGRALALVRGNEVNVMSETRCIVPRLRTADH